MDRMNLIIAKYKRKKENHLLLTVQYITKIRFKCILLHVHKARTKSPYQFN